MKLTNEGLRLWPTDLAAFARCPYQTSLELAVARGELARPFRPNAHAELIREKGLEHERAYLETVAHSARGGSPAKKNTETEAAARRGVDVIYQAALEDVSGWSGACDFLLRRSEPSELGAWSYRAGGHEARSRPSTRARLAAVLLRRAHGRAPGWCTDKMKLILGSGDQSELRPDDFLAYYRQLRQRYMRALDEPASSYPYPIEHCGLCDYFGLCQARWEEDVDLTLVADMRREQVVRPHRRGDRDA